MKINKKLALGALLLGLISANGGAEEQSRALNFNAGMDQLALQIVKSMVQADVKKIAILPFPDLNGKMNNLGIFVSEELITKLFMEKKFEVVERNLLDKVLKELSLNQSALIGDAAQKIGKLLGVDAILTGTITEMGGNIIINARLIGTETGKILAVARTAFPKEPEIIKMLNTAPVENQAPTPAASPPAPTPEHEAPPQPVPAQNQKRSLKTPCYVICVQAFMQQEAAESAAKILANNGYPSGYLWIPDYASLSGARLYLVYIGPYTNKADAITMLKTYKNTNPSAYGIKVDIVPGREIFK